MDTSRSSMLTPQMLRAFVNTHQMEQIDEQMAIKLIQVRFLLPSCPSAAPFLPLLFLRNSSFFFLFEKQNKHIQCHITSFICFEEKSDIEIPLTQEV